jgi:hypothetical protein
VDYEGWLDRLRRFVTAWRERLPPGRRGECSLEIDPPLTPQQVSALRQELDCPLPAVVEAFLTRAASRVSFSCPCATAGVDRRPAGGDLFQYWLGRADGQDRWEGAGGGLVEARQCVLDWATSENAWLVEPPWVLDRALWRHGLPLTQMPNTDCLALWVHDPADPNPAVIHLLHDGPSYIVSATFDDFLGEWESLGYDWGEEYLDPGTRLLTASSPAGRERHRLLGLA